MSSKFSALHESLLPYLALPCLHLMQGDSGGPLLCQNPNDKDRWFVGGIVSWGVMCAHPKLPGVYANVPKYIPWIMQQMHKYSAPANGL